MQPHSSTPRFATQSDKIENLLRSRYGEWIPAYELSDLALQYCARINSIRKKLRNAGESEVIENKTERMRGQVHGSYRIRRKDPNEHRPALAPQPSPKAIPDSPDWFEREFGARPGPRVATSDLPLFAGSSL
jgi:hypothetical protein